MLFCPMETGSEFSNVTVIENETQDGVESVAERSVHFLPTSYQFVPVSIASGQAIAWLLLIESSDCQ